MPGSELRSDLAAVGGIGGLPGWREIHGHQVRAGLWQDAARVPHRFALDGRQREVQALGEEGVLPVMEEFAGKKLALIPDSKRSMRVQQYLTKEHRFRWHCDGHAYVALVALENTNRGQTDFISPRLSWFLRYPLYPIRFFDRLCATFPYDSVMMEAGDMLIMDGATSLHRGVTHDEGGERLLLAYAFDEIGRKSNSIRDRIARKINY